MKFSAIIPVYNNQSTVRHVINVLQKHPKVTEVIVVNDGSQDNSLTILENISGIYLIDHERNKGKGAAIVSGWKAAKNDAILSADADLSALSLKHINDLVSKYETGKWDMVIGYDDIFNKLSGQRIYRKPVVLPSCYTAEKVGNGIEQVINHAHRGKKIAMVHTNNIGHILKYQRHPISLAMWLYLKEAWQLAKTEYLLRTDYR